MNHVFTDRWVFFVEELTSPAHVPAGSIRQLDPELLAQLRVTKRGRDAVIDITPKQVAVGLALYGGYANAPRKDSTAVLFPCPWCVEVNKTTGQARIVNPLTKCVECDGARAIAIPGNWPGAANTIKRIQP